MKLIVLAYTSKIYKSEPMYTGTNGVITDRGDLLRKLPCMDTWVGRVLELGHEVIFFDGGYDEVTYDEKNNFLHLTSNDSYDYYYLKENNQPSNMLNKLQEAIKWCLENKEFDFILRIDDGTYLNSYVLNDFLEQYSDKDLIWSGYGGGGGMFFSKKGCETLINYKNTEYHLEDIAVFNSPLVNSNFNLGTSKKMSPSYVLGENLLTIHYATGKRMYYCDFVISNYYNQQIIGRNIVLNYPIPPTKELKTNTIDCSVGKTPLWYGLDRDNKNWEYYGAYTRSSYQMMYDYDDFKPFGKNIKNLFIYEIPNENLVQNINEYKKLLIENGNLYICFNEIPNEIYQFNFEYIDNFETEYIKNNVKKIIKIN